MCYAQAKRQNKLADIICYTSANQLVALQFGVRLQEEFIWWSLTNTPKQLKVGDRVYFACDKKIRGYFKLLEHHIGTRKISKDKDYKGSHLVLGPWTEIKPMTIKDFKKETGGSWRYMMKVRKKLAEGSDDY